MWIYAHAPGRFFDAVFHKIFKRRHTDGTLEAAAALTFADEDGVCDIVKRNGLHKMLPNVKNSLSDSLIIKVCAVR